MANVNATPTTLEQYREAKNQYLKLKNQAKKELMARFHALAAELLQVQRELLEDFGEKVTLPLKPARPKKPQAAPQPVAAAAPTAAPAAPPVESAKTAALTRQLEKQKKKLDGLKAAGKPTRAVEDRIYELEDEIRLSQ